jgi:ubiquinone/menaquinone biosynthesis C-methylase UbiE
MASSIGNLRDRLFAAVYDRMTGASERAGLADLRHGLVADARGATLDLGAGTGLNLRHYPPAVERLVLVEPSPFMAAKLRERVAEARPSSSEAGPGRVEVVQAGAEAMPFADDEFDTVVVTLVLCTVPDPAVALREVARVLRPGGTLLFLEHVRASEPGVATWQDRLERPWSWIGNGCHPNRDTLATLNASPLSVESVRDARLPKAPPIVRPLIVGTARAS